MQDTLNWAVLGTGVIANEMAQALQKMGKSLYAVGNRTHEKAVAFAEKYGVPMATVSKCKSSNMGTGYEKSPHFAGIEKIL